MDHEQKTGILKSNIEPTKFLCKIVLGSVRKHSNFFIRDNDLRKIKRIGVASIIFFLLSVFVFYFLTRMNIVIVIAISIIGAMVFLFVFSDYIRATIIQRHQKFDEAAFLILNSLSINMVATQSFPHSIDFLVTNGISNKYYEKYFKEIIYKLNVGENEDAILRESGIIFLNKKYQNAFQNIRNEEEFVETDPDFLLKVKREIKIIEDNIVIFVAVSCLLPLVLSLVLALIIPPESPSIFVFPLLYALFGIFTLRFIQNRSMGD